MRQMYGVQLKDGKRFKDLMLVLGLNETVDQLALENSIHWYDYLLRREGGHVLRH